MKRIVAILAIMFCSPAFSATVPDYLLETNIGGYSPSYPGACPKGSGVVAGAKHFRADHEDDACDIRYYNPTFDLGVEVQVTKHTGGDSDQWLLHEVESSFRGRTKEGWLGQSVYESTSIRLIGNNRIFDYGNTDYRWISGNLVVKISYTDLEGTKPEPLEIVQAYLQKFPSAIPATLVLDRAHDEQWIKDEMTRRLWLGDKWFTHQAANNTDISETLREVNRSLEVFLNYREKYFGVSIDNEKETLYQLLSTQNFQGMKDKLTEYKSWWATNKSGSINLP